MGHLPSVARSDADGGDRGAGEADKSVDVLHDDAEGPKDGRSRGGARLLNALAALDGPSAARLSEGRGGDGKDCGGGEYEELGEHGGLVDAEY